MEPRGRFWPALGRVAVLGAAAVADLGAFFGGTSRVGNSTSCVRSRRESGTHSGTHRQYMVYNLICWALTIETFVEFFIVDTGICENDCQRIERKGCSLLVMRKSFSGLNRQNLCLPFLAILQLGVSIDPLQTPLDNKKTVMGV